MTEAKKHLYNLNELSDYKVSDGYTNVQGWQVKDRDNRVIGKVDNLLVNLDAQRVVYLDVEVDKTIIDAKYDPYSPSSNPEVKEFINKDGENHVIIPIGLIDINESQKFVFTETIDHRTFAETKRYSKGTQGVSRDYEVAVLDSYARSYDKEVIDENQVRKIVKEEVSNLNVVNKKEGEFQEEGKIREIVREEVENSQFVHNKENELIHSDIYDKNEQEPLSAKRERLHRDDFERISNHENESGLDFDHDNDGNPNITDADYYRAKNDRLKSVDFDHDNDGNPNITDSDYYKAKGKKVKNMDFDHDNDGNPNITDPDYYSEKLGRNKGDDRRYIRDTHDVDLEKRRRNSDVYDDDDFYERREFNDSKFRRD